MRGEEIAGLIAAGAFVVLVLFAAVPLWKLGRMIDSGTRRVEQSSKLIDELGKMIDTGTDRVQQSSLIIDEAVERLQQAGATVELANANLAHVERLAANVEAISQNVSGLTSIFAATLGSPLVKVASFSYGVRRASATRQHAEVEKELKSRLRAERVGRRADKRAARSS